MEGHSLNSILGSDKRESLTCNSHKLWFLLLNAYFPATILDSVPKGPSENNWIEKRNQQPERRQSELSTSVAIVRGSNKWFRKWFMAHSSNYQDPQSAQDTGQGWTQELQTKSHGHSQDPDDNCVPFVAVAAPLCVWVWHYCICQQHHCRH